MKNINLYILEKLKINSSSGIKVKSKNELLNIIDRRVKESEDGHIDLNDIDISEIKDLSYLFEDLKVKVIDANSWNTKNVTDLHGLCWNNQFIEEINISNWDVSNVTTLYGTFFKCHNLKTLDLSKWDVSNVSEMNLTFNECTSLPEDFNLDSWNKNSIVDGGKVDGFMSECKFKRPEWYNMLLKK